MEREQQLDSDFSYDFSSVMSQDFGKKPDPELKKTGGPVYDIEVRDLESIDMPTESVDSPSESFSSKSSSSYNPGFTQKNI